MHQIAQLRAGRVPDSRSSNSYEYPTDSKSSGAGESERESSPSAQKLADQRLRTSMIRFRITCTVKLTYWTIIRTNQVIIRTYRTKIRIQLPRMQNSRTLINVDPRRLRVSNTSSRDSENTYEGSQMNAQVRIVRRKALTVSVVQFTQVDRS